MTAQDGINIQESRINQKSNNAVPGMIYMEATLYASYEA